MRTIGVLAFISLYRCVESANRGSGSAIDPSTWTEEELLWFPFNAILVALTIWAIAWAVQRRRAGLPLIYTSEMESTNDLRAELRRHRRFIDRD